MSYKVRNADKAKGHLHDTPRWQIDRDIERGPCLATEYMRGPLTMRALQAYCEVNGRQLDYCSHYGEPGYSDPAKGLLFADWNDIPKSLQTRLESQGYELEWSDEWYVDSNNDKAYRTSPDSYGWESSLMFSEACGDYLTPDDDVSDWIAQCENNNRVALPSWIAESDIIAAGWEKQADVYENGFHPGQTDDPVKIAKFHTDAGREYLFQIGGVGQFDVRFCVWVKSPEEVDSDSDA